MIVYIVCYRYFLYNRDVETTYNERTGIMNQKGKTILFLAALAGATIHILNRFEYSLSTSKNLLATSDNRYYEWRFGKIRYRKKGQGTPLLLLHDLTVGSSSYEYSKIIDKLSQNHEVYCIDFLGYGLSDKPDITFTNYLYVQLISDFIKNVIGKKTDVVAAGDAFPVAVMVCHNDSNTIRKLVAINPQSLFQLNQIPSKQTRVLKFLMDTPVLGTFIYNLHTNKTAIGKIFEEEYFYNPYNIEEKDILSYVEAAHMSDYHSKHAYASYIGKYTNANIIHAIKEINNSIYMIAGENKPENHTIMDNYTYYNNAIEVSYISETKQLPHLEKPEEVLSCLDVYLE